MAADINEDRARGTAAMIAKAVGAASVLVNNAGIVRRETISAANADADWDRTAFGPTPSGPV